MNVLSREKQIAVTNALVEGCSMRTTERLTGVNRETVGTLLLRLGAGSEALLDDTMRDLPGTCWEIDEIWSFCGKKERRIKETDDRSRCGDQWTYVAIAPDTKLVPCFMTGKRDFDTTRAFIRELAKRVRSRIQLSSDAMQMYADAIRAEFVAIDYAQLHKSYSSYPFGSGRYSPPQVSGVTKVPIFGKPHEELVSTSYVERQNLSMRMQMRRFTRLTNGYSKKLECHGAAIALHFAHYNFVRQHHTLRCTPAMAAGVTRTMWSTGELLEAVLDGTRP